MNKKGLELTLGTMVISILVLTVLIVLILIFMGVIKVQQNGIQDCDSRRGTCDQGPDCGGPNSEYAKIPGAYCKDGAGNFDKTTTCCVPTS